MEKGFYFYTPTCDWFFVTAQIKKTAKFVEGVDNLLKDNGCRYNGTFGTFNLSEMLQPATIEKGSSEKFGDFYTIKGDGWTAGDFTKNKPTQIVYL